MCNNCVMSEVGAASCTTYPRIFFRAHVRLIWFACARVAEWGLDFSCIEVLFTGVCLYIRLEYMLLRSICASPCSTSFCNDLKLLCFWARFATLIHMDDWRPRRRPRLKSHCLGDAHAKWVRTLSFIRQIVYVSMIQSWTPFAWRPLAISYHALFWLPFFQERQSLVNSHVA